MRSALQGRSTTAPAPSIRDLHYGRFASIYDFLGDVWTAGRIRASKLSQIEQIRAGDRVLYAGCGTGEDALAAARKGAHVVVVELSPQMMTRVQRRFAAAGFEAEFCCEDAARHIASRTYDVVTANFFLNIFEPAAMEYMLSQLARQLRPGGKLLIADFAPPSGGFFSNLGAQLLHGVPMMIFAATVNQPLHRIYDYAPVLDRCGLAIQHTHYFDLYGDWSRWILSLRADAPL